MRSRAVRIVLSACLVLQFLLLAVAGLRRTAVHEQLRTQLVQDLVPIAERGLEEVDRYLWQAQGPAIYLLQRAYSSKQLERSLLLCEARRCYDWCYLYTRVRNHDLRSFLSASCLQAFPDDPKVHWATGQLALAAGDFALAEQELARTLQLAETGPGGLPGFLAALGSTELLVEGGLAASDGTAAPPVRMIRSSTVSEQHLRGRYACALRMMGKPEEAGRQEALARQAADGKLAPPPESWDDYLVSEWYRQENPEAYAFEMSVRELAQREQFRRRRSVELFLHSKDLVQLRPIKEELASLARQIAADPDDSYIAVQSRRELEEELLRAYLLAHDWQEADLLLTAMSASTDGGYSEDSLRLASGRLLTRLAAGLPLGASAEELRELKLSELRASYPDEDEEDWRWDLAYTNHGELSALLTADYLPFLLQTDGFAVALAKSGRPLGEVLTELRQVVLPQRDKYFDSSNGWLDLPAERLPR